MDSKQKHWEDHGIDPIMEQQGFKVGDTIDVTHPRYPDHKWVYRILNDDIRDRPCAQIELGLLRLYADRSETKIHKLGERTVFVENNWFDQKLTNRKIKHCMNKNLISL